jgi:hypothetical protein
MVHQEKSAAVLCYAWADNYAIPGEAEGARWKCVAAPKGGPRMEADIAAMTDRTNRGPLAGHAECPVAVCDAWEGEPDLSTGGVFLGCRPLAPSP